MIYLDNAATTRVAPEVLEAMMPYMTNEYGNAGTTYSIGRRARDAVEKAREQVSAVFGCAPEKIIFTSGGTESNNLAIKGVCEHLRNSGKTHIVTTAIEHDSVLKSVKSVANNGFTSEHIIPCRHGYIEFESIEKALENKNTGILSMMYINNETGAKNCIDRAASICLKNDVLFHSDCVQGLLKSDSAEPIPSGLSFASISSHKLHGPKGTGALYAKNPEILEPLICGGAVQEFGFRGGTENVPGIVGFGAACEMALKMKDSDNNYISQLKHQFLAALRQYAACDMQVNGSSDADSNKILNACFPGVAAETLVVTMDTHDICISSGSACKAHELKPSHVLTAMGLSDEEARSSVRISFSRYNTLEEVTEAAKTMASCISRLRMIKQ